MKIFHLMIFFVSTAARTLKTSDVKPTVVSYNEYDAVKLYKLTQKFVAILKKKNSTKRCKSYFWKGRRSC